MTQVLSRYIKPARWIPGLNVAHPLAKDLIIAMSFNEGMGAGVQNHAARFRTGVDLGTGNNGPFWPWLTGITEPTWEATSEGMCLKANGIAADNQGIMEARWNGQLVRNSREFTFAWRTWHDSPDSEVLIHLASSGFSNELLQIAAASGGGGNVSANNIDGTGGAASAGAEKLGETGGTWLNAGFHSGVVVIANLESGAGTMTLTVESVSGHTYSETASSVSDAGLTSFSQISIGTRAGQSEIHCYFGCLLWSLRAWTDNEVAMFIQDPYGVFRQPDDIHRRHVTAVGGTILPQVMQHGLYAGSAA